MKAVPKRTTSTTQSYSAKTGWTSSANCEPAGALSLEASQAARLGPAAALGIQPAQGQDLGLKDSKIFLVDVLCLGQG